jgi:PAS domain S-box-containing protein
VQERLRERMDDYTRGVRDLATIFEVEILIKDGGSRWFEISSNAVFGPGGTIAGFQGISRDITEPKQVEDALRGSEEKYRWLYDSMRDAFVSVEMGGRITLFNKSFQKMVGYEEGELYNLTYNDLTPDKWHTIEADIVKKQVLTRGYSGIYEKEYRRKDGTVIPVELHAFLIKDDAGNPQGMSAIVRDITERKRGEEIRKAYEVRLDSAMEIGGLAWWEMDLPDGAVRFDDRKAIMLGYPPGQFKQYSDFTALLHPDDREPAMQAMQDHLEDRQSRYHIDYRIRTAAGNYRWFRDVGGITRHHPDGSPATITGIVIDITVSKQAEETLRATETRYRALIQNSSDIIRILDREGLIVYESASSERILGYPRGYLTGKNPLEYIHPDDIEHVKTAFREVIDGVNPSIPTEFRIRKADGEYIWVNSIGTNLLDVPGVNGIVITTRPIQQRKEAEQALRENEARLATAMDIAGLVNWEFDVATGIFTFDDRFYALYATTADQEGGNRMSAETYMKEFVYPDDRPMVLAEIKKLLATTDPAYTGQQEHRITPRDGSVRTIIARYAPVMGPDGKVIRTHGANQDITDFKLMESEIRSLNTVLEQRVKDRTEALLKANEALEAEVAQRLIAEKNLQALYDEKVILLKEIHHRVKNNLQIIASLLNLQSRYIKDELSLSVIRESQNRVKAMALVHEKLYRSEDISHISLNDYIRFLGTGLFQFYDAKLRGIQFRLEIQDVNVDIDAAIPLGLILNELISNSLKYAFPDGRQGEIAIRVTKEEHTLTVLCRDNGIGIPGDLDWRDTQSLGLRLVNTLVDQLNGTVELDRSSGTLFTMVLHEKEQRGPS